MADFGNANISIIDLNGRVIRNLGQMGAELLTLDISDIDTGTYFIVLKSDSGIQKTEALIIVE